MFCRICQAHSSGREDIPDPVISGSATSIINGLEFGHARISTEVIPGTSRTDAAKCLACQASLCVGAFLAGLTYRQDIQANRYAILSKASSRLMVTKTFAGSWLLPTYI